MWPQALNLGLGAVTANPYLCLIDRGSKNRVLSAILNVVFDGLCDKLGPCRLNTNAGTAHDLRDYIQKFFLPPLEVDVSWVPVFALSFRHSHIWPYMYIYSHNQPVSREFEEVLKIEEDLVEVAAEASIGLEAAGPVQEELAAWITAMLEAKKNALLLKAAACAA